MADNLTVSTAAAVPYVTGPIPSYVFTADVFFLAIYFIATFIGLPGNMLAVIYFVRPSVKRDLSSSLYIAVSVTDVLLSFAQIPVIASLLSDRQPALFSFPFVCVSWRLVFKSLQRFSVFLVLLLSISRTLSLVRPLSKVKRTTTLRAMYGYMCYIVVETSVFGSLEGYSYDRTGGYCYENGYKPTSQLYNALYIITLGVPALVTFVSFIVSTLAIRRSMTCSRTLSCEGMGPGTRDSIKKQATNTIMIFTFTYLLCNLPHFVNMILWIITMSLNCGEGSCYPGPLYDNPFMYWFSWNISEVLSVIVNMACNPIIYYFRISQFNQWVNQIKVFRRVNRFLMCN